MQMVVMRGRQLEAGAPIRVRQLLDGAVRSKALGGAKHGRKVRGCSSTRESSLEILKAPGVTVLMLHQAHHRGRDAWSSCHARGNTTA